jgi:hypothetical protein
MINQPSFIKKEHNLSEDYLEYVAYLPTGLLTQEKKCRKNGFGLTIVHTPLLHNLTILHTTPNDTRPPVNLESSSPHSLYS